MSESRWAERFTEAAWYLCDVRRWVALLTFASLLNLGSAQDAQPEVIDPSMVPPQVSIVVKEHAATPDLIEITMLDPNYPQDRLREQVLKIGQITGTGIRGLDINKVQFDTQIPQGFVKARFATDHVIDRSTGRLNLGSLVEPFLGSAEPFEIRSFLITFDGETPTEKTLRVYADKYVAVKAEQITSPPGIDYRIVVFSQDPEKVNIPLEPSQAQAPADGDKVEVKGLPVGLLISLIVIAGLAAGALVYFALLKTPRVRRGS